MINLPNIHIYLSKYYIDMFDDLEKYYDFSNNIFLNQKLNIIYHYNFDINYLDKYDIIIKMKSNYSQHVLNIMKTNIIFINTFIDFITLENKNIIMNNNKLYPFTFYLSSVNIDIIQYHLNVYNNKYNNNEIDIDFGKEYWIVKDNLGNRGINTELYNTNELLSLKRKDVIIQKYLEKPFFHEPKRKVDLRVHFLIYPKIIKNKQTNKYEIKYSKNDKIKLSFYLHKLVISRYTLSDYDLNNKDMTKHLTNLHIQTEHASSNSYYDISTILYKRIKDKIKLFLKSKEIKDKIYEGTKNYPYFYQIVALDLLLTNTKHDIYIIDFNLNPGIYSKTLFKTRFILLCFQKIFRMIYKLKYNIKVKNNDNLFITNLDKI